MRFLGKAVANVAKVATSCMFYRIFDYVYMLFKMLQVHDYFVVVIYVFLLE
jgi:hypothetical protein